MFLTLNTGKRSVTLDLATRTGRELLLQLAGRADLIVESYRPGTLERFGLGPERLAQAGPAALVRISNFGQTGPRRDFAADDLIEYAAAGILQITGLPDREPVALGLFTPLFLAGAICAPLALGAMRAAHRDQQQEVRRLLHPGGAGRLDGPRRPEPGQLPVHRQPDVRAPGRSACAARCRTASSSAPTATSRSRRR